MLKSFVMIMFLRTSECADFDWEDFDAAITEEDCFGEQCEGNSGALFMMQGKITKTSLKDQMHWAGWPKERRQRERITKITKIAKVTARKDQIEASKLSGEESHAFADISMQDLADAVESEDGGSAQGLALVQTEASVQRVSTDSGHEHVFGAVAADGSIEINSHEEAAPNDGMMHFSVDSHGAIHSEHSMSLLQAEMRVTKTKTPVALSSEDKSDNDVFPSELNDFEESEGLSLMQTDISGSDGIIPYSVHTDGAIELNPKEIAVPSNGMMAISVDSHGDYHSEEGFMLVQTKAQIGTAEADSESTSLQGDSLSSLTILQAQEMAESSEADSELDESLVGASVAGHPSWTIEAMEEFAGVSLMQKDAQMHRSTAVSVNADGTLDVEENKAEFQRDGTVHMSVDAMGHFHYEI
jgi:hypothetical protein